MNTTGYSHRRCLIGVAASLGLLALAAPGLAAETPAAALLAVESSAGQLAIIDPDNLKVVARIPVGPDPHEVVASADGKTAYVSNYMGLHGVHHSIARVDLVAQKALAPIELGALEAPHGLSFAGGKLYFTAEFSKAIGRYDPGAEKIDWLLGTGQDGIHLVWVVGASDRIFTSNAASASVSIIERAAPRDGGAQANATAPWTVANVPAGRGAEGVDFSPDGKQLWVANRQDATITVIDLASKTAQATIPVSARGLNRLLFTPDGKYALITAVEVGPNLPNLVVVDVASRKEIKKVSLGAGAGPMVLDAKHGRVFMSPLNVDKLIVFDLKTLSVSGEVAQVINPNGLAWAERTR